MKENNKQLEFEILKNDIANLDWNDKNLVKHTLRHPIGDWQNDGYSMNENQLYKMLWGNLLGTYNIPKDTNGSNFNDIKERYRKVSLEVLAKSYNSIMYFHDGINNDGKKYRSVGVFEDREYKSNEKILTTFIRGNFNDNEKNYYITTCYFKNKGFKEKFYYTYMILREPELFNIILDTDKFFKMNGICNDISLDKLNKLLDKSLLNDDKVGEIFNYYVVNGKIDTDRYLYLYNLYKNNYYISDIREINRMLDINNQLINELNNKKIQLLDNDMYEDDVIKKLVNCISKSDWFSVNTIKLKLKKKYFYDNSINELISKIVSVSDIEDFLRMLYENNRDFSEEEFETFYDDCYLTLKIFMLSIYIVDSVNKCCDLNDCCIKDYCCDILSIKPIIENALIDMIIRFIERKNDKLYEDKNFISCDMYMDDENMFYLSLYHNLAKSYSDYNDTLFEYSSKYDDEILKILEDNINNYD